MIAVAAPRQRIFMSVHSHVKMIALHSTTFVLHNADSYPFNVQNRTVWKNGLVCRYGDACLYGLSAGRNSVSFSADI